MSVWLLTGKCDGERERTVMVDSVTEWAFGPTFPDAPTAEMFLAWLGYDPRGMSDVDLADAHAQWVNRK